MRNSTRQTRRGGAKTTAARRCARSIPAVPWCAVTGGSGESEGIAIEPACSIVMPSTPFISGAPLMAFDA
ncbi:hypothetical protein [Streptomyces sp. NPDC057257]|uniref:hypothetical protein n=1 Tax=Streptomyces sp. NPDC057257 TaxID=3346071 RepID=UPI00362F0B70